MNSFMEAQMEYVNERWSYKMIKKRDLNIVKYILEYPNLYITMQQFDDFYLYFKTISKE